MAAKKRNATTAVRMARRIAFILPRKWREYSCHEIRNAMAEAGRANTVPSDTVRRSNTLLVGGTPLWYSQDVPLEFRRL